MKNAMHIDFVVGKSADGMKVTIMSEQKVIFRKEYSYGYNASYSREFETNEKPFIGDVLKDLIDCYYIEEEHIVYSGYNYFIEKPLCAEEIEDRIDRIIEYL